MEEADFLMFSSLEGRGGPIVRTGSGWSTVTERNAIDTQVGGVGARNEKNKLGIGRLQVQQATL